MLTHCLASAGSYRASTCMRTGLSARLHSWLRYPPPTMACRVCCSGVPPHLPDLHLASVCCSSTSASLSQKPSFPSCWLLFCLICLGLPRPIFDPFQLADCSHVHGSSLLLSRPHLVLFQRLVADVAHFQSWTCPSAGTAP